MAYRWLFPEALFRVETNRKEVYLTFDDGPHPEATPFVLDVLKAHGIKATFFVLGKNALAYPELLERMKREGHVIGNHGMDHLNGWTTGLDQYLEDQRAGKHVVNSSIFRPAYGKMSLSQYKELSKTDQIVFWDVISGDFDTEIDGDRVKRNVIDNVRSGSVIVFHDSKKAFPNIKSSLNDIIGQLGENGYSFGTLTSR
ncbi:MAG: putative polysaccharide deacetylase pdaA precursor [Bacteroidota bacterium]|jgi:peptidoglycan/xylan/chitin deacetylase (PgdA/CDA1 family)